MESIATFKQRIEDTKKTPLAKSFIIFIRGIAIENDKSEDVIYRLWKEYCAKCQGYDQSPVKYEFCQWYKLQSTDGLLQLV